MSLATRMSQLVGMPIEKAMPAVGYWPTIVTRITKAALKKALDGDIVFPETCAKKAGE